MAGNLWGADVAQLRTLAQQFGKTSETLLQQSTTLTSAINGNTAWKGADGVPVQVRMERQPPCPDPEDRDGPQGRVQAADDPRRAAGEGQQRGRRSRGRAGCPPSGRQWIRRLGPPQRSRRRGRDPGRDGHPKKHQSPASPLAKHVGQYGWVLKNQRADFIKSFVQGKHRIGGPGFAPHRLISNPALDDLLKGSAAANRGLAAIDKASDIASLKNLNKYIGPLSKFGPLLEEKAWLGAGTKLEWLGKSGLARGLGWAGIGFSAVDSVQSFADGDIKGGMASAGKGLLGVGCFLPPPAGTVCQVASVGIAIYENWDTISSVGKNVGEGIVNAVKDPGKFVSDAADNVVDAGKSVANFFGFGD